MLFVNLVNLQGQVTITFIEMLYINVLWQKYILFYNTRIRQYEEIKIVNVYG